MTDRYKYKINYEVLLNHLKSKWGDPKPCPMCGQAKWNVENAVFEIRQFKKGDEYFGPYYYWPIIPITCANCGFVAPINANVANMPEDTWTREEE